MRKILHIASFVGNIGDNASHMGLYNILDSIIGELEYSIEKLEIRKFYKNYSLKDNLFFNRDFIDYLNSFDLCIIGGGGFLDYWIPDSLTGTTIDIDPNLLDLIKTKTLFTSIGCNPHRTVPDGNICKIQNFFNKALNNKNIKIYVRNDGSVNSISEDIGKHYLLEIKEILDHGFFFNAPSNTFINQKYVAINITYDQISMISKNRDVIDIVNYTKELVTIVNYIIDTLHFHVVFVPHIYTDLKAINQLLEYINDFKVRNSISVAPYLQKDEGARFLFSIYKNSEFVIGTRYHANVCSMAMNKRVLGLATLDRVEYLFNFFSKPNQSIIPVSKFSEEIIDLIKYEDFSSVNNRLISDYKKQVIDNYLDFIC